MWTCTNCNKLLDPPCDPCCHCKNASGVSSHIARAGRDAPHLRKRFDQAVSSSEPQDLLERCENMIQDAVGVSINMPRVVLQQMLYSSKFRYINYHDRLRAEMNTEVDRENKAKREGLDALLFGDDGSRLTFGALNLGTLGVHSYGEACVFLSADRLQAATSFLETNTYSYYRDDADADVHVQVRRGSRALWTTVGLLAVVKHQPDLLTDSGEWDVRMLGELLIRSEGDKNTDEYIEAQIGVAVTSADFRRILLDPSKAREAQAGGLIDEIEAFERESSELLRKHIASSIAFEIVPPCRRPGVIHEAATDA